MNDEMIKPMDSSAALTLISINRVRHDRHSFGQLKPEPCSERQRTHERRTAVPDLSEFKELTQLLLILFEAAKRLPPGAERASALKVIDSFQKRLTAHIRQTQAHEN